MSLYEALKEVDKQIEDIEGAPAAAEKEEKQEPAPADKPDKEPAAPAKDVKPEKDDALAKPEAKSEEEKPDAAAFAKLRKEASDAKREREAADNRARIAEERLNAKPAATAAEQPAPAAKAATDPEPDKNTDPDAHVRWELRQAKAQLQDLGQWRVEREKKERYEENLTVAREEFSNFEQQFQGREDAKDYVDVANYAVAAIAQSIRIMNPGLPQKEVAKRAELQLLARAGAYQKAGHANPIEALYHEVKNTWGYQPKAAPAAAATEGEGEEGQPRADDGKFEKKPIKPSLKQIADNKKKSASSMTPGGKSGSSPLTRDGLMKGGLSEWARLTPEQLRQAEELEG